MTQNRPPADLAWSIELIKSLFRLVKKRSSLNRPKDPLDYFSSITITEYEKHHVDISNRIFYHYLKSSRIVSNYLNKDNITIYDVGSGTGKLFDHLLFKSTCKLVLIDFVQKKLDYSKQKLKKQFNEIELVTADIRSDPIPNKQANIIFCINVLPYIKSFKTFIDTSYNTLSISGQLCLIFPSKSIVWEEEFDGVRIFYHNADDIKKYACNIGYNLAEETDIKFSIPLTFGIFNFTIAKMLILTK